MLWDHVHRPRPVHEAPARTVADQTAAVVAQQGRAFAKSTMDTSGVSQKNVTCEAWVHLLCMHYIYSYSIRYIKYNIQYSIYNIDYN